MFKISIRSLHSGPKSPSNVGASTPSKIRDSVIFEKPASNQKPPSVPTATNNSSNGTSQKPPVYILFIYLTKV